MDEDGDVKRPLGIGSVAMATLVALVVLGVYHVAGTQSETEPVEVAETTIDNPSDNVSDGVYFACMGTIGAVELYKEGKCTSEAMLAYVESYEQDIRGMGTASGDSLAVSCIRNIINYAHGLPTYYDGGGNIMMIEKYCSDIVDVIRGD